MLISTLVVAGCTKEPVEQTEDFNNSEKHLSRVSSYSNISGDPGYSVENYTWQNDMLVKCVFSSDYYNQPIEYFFSYDGSNLVSIQNNKGDTFSFVYDNDRIVSMKINNGQIIYYQYDLQGNVIGYRDTHYYGFKYYDYVEESGSYSWIDGNCKSCNIIYYDTFVTTNEGEDSSYYHESLVIYQEYNRFFEYDNGKSIYEGFPLGFFLCPGLGNLVNNNGNNQIAETSTWFEKYYYYTEGVLDSTIERTVSRTISLSHTYDKGYVISTVANITGNDVNNATKEVYYKYTDGSGLTQKR